MMEQTIWITWMNMTPIGILWIIIIAIGFIIKIFILRYLLLRYLKMMENKK